MIERTFVAIKPDGVKRGLIGKIIERFEDAGLKIVGLKMVLVTKEFAEKHYEEHRGELFYKPLLKYITEGPVVAMVLEGVKAIKVVRKMVGATNPEEAAPGTIRGDFSHLSLEYSNLKNRGGANIIHASDSKETAEKEISLWFKPEEIFEYKRLDEYYTTLGDKP